MAIPPQPCTSTAVVELAADPLRASWLTCELRANYPMALEPNGKLLWVGFRLPERLAAFDTASGTIQTSAATCGDTDDLFVDDRSKRIYVICGSGGIGVYDTSRGGAIRTGTVPTRSGASTVLLVPQLDRLYVAARVTLMEPGGDADLSTPTKTLKRDAPRHNVVEWRRDERHETGRAPRVEGIATSVILVNLRLRHHWQRGYTLTNQA